MSTVEYRRRSHLGMVKHNRPISPAPKLSTLPPCASPPSDSLTSYLPTFITSRGKSTGGRPADPRHPPRGNLYRGEDVHKEGDPALTTEPLGQPRPSAVLHQQQQLQTNHAPCIHHLPQAPPPLPLLPRQAGGSCNGSGEAVRDTRQGELEQSRAPGADWELLPQGGVVPAEQGVEDVGGEGEGGGGEEEVDAGDGEGGGLRRLRVKSDVCPARTVIEPVQTTHAPADIVQNVSELGRVVLT